jgi:heme exporter protein CcmD
MSHTPYILSAFGFAFCVLAILAGWVVLADHRVRRALKQYEADDL